MTERESVAVRSADATQPPPVRLRRRRRVRDRQLFLLVAVALGGILLFNVYPMVWLFGGSIEGESGGLSLQKYTDIFSSLGPFDALKNSLLFASFSLVFGLALAIISSVGTTRLDTPFSRTVKAFSIIAFVNPPWILAMAYSWLLSPNAGTFNVWFDNLFGIKPFNGFSLPAMVFVAGLFLYPYLYLIISSAMENMDSSYEEAAMTTGASPWKTLRKVTLPLVSPAIITASIFSVVILWGFFTIPAILGVPGKVYVFATFLFRLLRTPPTDFALTSAMGVFFAVTAGLFVVVGFRLVNRTQAGRFHVVGGKGHKAVKMRVGWVRWPLGIFNLLIVSFALLIPYGVIFSLAIRDRVYEAVSFSNLSLRHFTDHLTSPVFAQILLNTLKLALFMAIIGGALALIIAYFGLRGRDPMRGVVSAGGTFLIGVPAVAFVIGVATAWLRSPIVLYGTLWIIMFGQVARFLPLGVQHLRDGLNQLHPDLEEAARTCGAGTFVVLARITVPAIKPVAVATFLLLWMASMRDLVTPLFLSTGTTDTATLSSRVFFLWGEGQAAASSSLAVILVGLMFALYIAVRLVLGRAKRKGAVATASVAQTGAGTGL